MNKTVHSVYIGSFIVVSLLVTLWLAVDGFGYYSTSLEERFFHQSHSLLKPSGVNGHGYGIAGTLMMIVGVAVYMVRKRSKGWFSFGYLKHWLEFHIFLCSLGPILVLYHTAFKFGGIVAVSFWSMTAVVVSGIIGRFIYVRIPRTIQGQELNINELNQMSESLTLELKNNFSLSEDILNKINLISADTSYKESGSFALLFEDFFKTRRVLGRLKKELKSSGIPHSSVKETFRAVRDKINISRRIVLLKNTQRLFRYWHIVHLPFAITMFVIMVIHVVITIMFGYKWIF